MSRNLPRGVYKSGKGYVSKVKLPTGRWMSRSFKTQSKAESWFAAAELALLDGRPVPDPRRAGQSGGEMYLRLDELVRRWLDYHYPDPSANGKGGCNPETKKHTASLARKHVLSRLGDLTLVEITIQDVDDLARHLHSFLSFDYAEKGCWVLRASLHYAHQRGWVSTNVAALPGRRPRPRAHKPLYLTLTDTVKMASQVRAEFRIGIYLQRLCGLRIGELFGLQIQDVDLDNRILVLWKQGGRVSLRADENGMVDELKGRKEFRHVGIPQVLVEPIREHIRAHLPDARPTTRLIPSVLGSMAYAAYGSSIPRAAEQLGIKDPHGRNFRSHWLRAAMLTDLHRSGVNPRDISAIGGHSTSDPAAGSPITFGYYIIDVGDVRVQLEVAAVIDARVSDELGGDIRVVDRGEEWVSIAQAAQELGVGVPAVRHQVQEGHLVAETTRDPGHNVRRTWVLRASLDSRLAVLNDRVSLSAASTALGISRTTLTSVLEHLRITPIQAQEGSAKKWLSETDISRVRQTLDREATFRTRNVALGEAAAELGMTHDGVRRDLTVGRLQRPRHVPARLRADAVWITRKSVCAHPNYATATTRRPADHLTVSEVAHRARVSEATVRRWLRDGRLTAVHRFRRLWVCQSDVDRLLDQQRGAA